jgi:hypothetical protein
MMVEAGSIVAAMDWFELWAKLAGETAFRSASPGVV